jgi:CcmD family protein
MDILVAAYVIVWAAVGLYVIRMGARQRRLEQNLQALEQQLSAFDGRQLQQAA